MCNTTMMRNGSIVKEITTGELYKMRKAGELVTLTPVKKVWVEDEAVYTPIDGAESKEVPSGTFNLFFEVVEYAQPEVPKGEDFSIKGGKLYMNGERIETGELVIEKFLTAIPGKALFLVKARKGDRHDVKVYDLERDDFFPLYNAQGCEKVELVFADPENGVTAIAVTFANKFLIPSKAEDADPVEAVEETRYLVVYNGTNEISDDYNIYGANTTPAVYVTEEDGAKTVRLLFIGTDAYKSVYDTDGERHFVRSPEDDGQHTTVHVGEIHMGDGYTEVSLNTTHFAGTVKKVLPAPQGDFVFVTEGPDGIVHTNFDSSYGKRLALGEASDGRKIIDVVEEYPIPLAIIMNGDTDTTFVFGNDRYEAVKIHVVKTAGKGFVTTIE